MAERKISYITDPVADIGVWFFSTTSVGFLGADVHNFFKTLLSLQAQETRKKIDAITVHQHTDLHPGWVESSLGLDILESKIKGNFTHRWCS